MQIADCHNFGVLGIMIAIDCQKEMVNGGLEVARSLFPLDVEEPLVLYLYYAPGPAKRMSFDEAARLMKSLETATRSQSGWLH